MICFEGRILFLAEVMDPYHAVHGIGLVVWKCLGRTKMGGLR